MAGDINVKKTSSKDSCVCSAASPKGKIGAIALKALKMLSLSEGKTEKEYAVANFIRMQSIDCFSVQAQSVKQDEVLKNMRDKVSRTGSVYKGKVSMDMLEYTANCLGKKLKDIK